MEEKDKEKTALSIPGHGLYQFSVMPFGLHSSSGTFERLMERLMAGLHWKILLLYLDDILVFSDTFDQMLERLGQVFDRLRKANLKLKAKKCKLLKKKVIFIGHPVSEEGIETDPEKISSVIDWRTPTNVTEVRSWVGFAS